MDAAENRHACAKRISAGYKRPGIPEIERRGSAPSNIDYWWRRWVAEKRDWRWLDSYRQQRENESLKLESHNITAHVARNYFARSKVTAEKWGASYGFSKQAISRALHGTPGKRSQVVLDQLASDIRGEPLHLRRELEALKEEVEGLTRKINDLEKRIQ